MLQQSLASLCALTRIVSQTKCKSYFASYLLSLQLAPSPARHSSDRAKLIIVANRDSVRHCFQRATWRLACSSIISTPTAVSRSRCVAKAHSVFPLRVATHNSYRFALQARYYSDHDDVSTLPLDRDRDSSLKVEAQNPDEVEDAELLGKRATRLKRLEALGPPRAPSDTVYMGNLFFDLTAEDLRKHMEQYGAVLKAVIVYDNRGVSKG